MKVKVRFSGIIQEKDGTVKRLYNIYLDDEYVGDEIVEATDNAKVVLQKIKLKPLKKPIIAQSDEIEKEIEVK